MIDKLEAEWRKHPVLHFSMAGGKHMDVEALNSYLDTILGSWEKMYGRIPGEDKKPNDRLSYLIEQAYRQTGEKVVVLIDEYDAPLLDTMVDEGQFAQLRNIMRNFYSPLKDCDPYLRFVFLTGITKFSQLSIFSELNNIKNVSMVDDYAGICGITKEELLTQMSEDIDRLAEAQEMSRDEAIEQLTQNYDGYHFSKNSPDIFNPFSLLNCFNRREIDNYWYASGTTSYLIDMVRKLKVSLSDIPEDISLAQEAFDVTLENYPTCGIVPMLWQVGYLAIKSHDRFSGNYAIGYPNEETKHSLKFLLDNLSPRRTTRAALPSTTCRL